VLTTWPGDVDALHARRERQRHGLHHAAPFAARATVVSWKCLPLRHGRLDLVAGTLFRCREVSSGWFEGSLDFNREQWIFGAEKKSVPHSICAHPRSFAVPIPQESRPARLPPVRGGHADVPAEERHEVTHIRIADRGNVLIAAVAIKQHLFGGVQTDLDQRVDHHFPLKT